MAPSIIKSPLLILILVKDSIFPFVNKINIPITELIIDIIFLISTFSLKNNTPIIHTITGVVLDIIDVLIGEVIPIPLKNNTPFNTIPRNASIKIYKTSFISI